MARKPEAVVVPLFRRGAELEGVPEVEMVSLPRATVSSDLTTRKTDVDLTGLPKTWLLIGPGGAGKTALARWLIHRMIEQGREAVLAALDPANRSLASWFGNVEMPPSKDGAHSARWLREFLEYLMTAKSSAIIDLGGGDVSLETVLTSAPDTHVALETAGLGVVACYVLTPRVDDLNILQTLEAVGFRPKATVIWLNEGRADPTMPREEAFAPIMRHSIFRAAIAHGAVVLWMPALDSDVMQEIEVKRLDFGMARDGQVPEGAKFFPIGGLRRSMVGRWLQRMEQAAMPILSWLP
jgi:hypothetical protein